MTIVDPLQFDTLDPGEALVVPESKTAAAAIDFGDAAQNWDHAMRIARMMSRSKLVPKQYIGEPYDIVVAMQYGAEVNLRPVAALQSIAVINGKPGLYGDGFLAVIMAAPAYVRHDEYYELADGTQADGLRPNDYSNEETRAICQIWRRGIVKPFTGTFSIADAKRAKLWGKEGPWQTNPARMLKWRARGFAGRDGFAAELRGLRPAEELRDAADEEPLDPVPATPTPIARPVRKSEKAKRAAAVPPAQTPTPAAPDPEVPRQVLESLAILDTKFMEPATYEVVARLTKEGEPPTRYVFRTDDEDVYNLAASAEGSPQVFRVIWHESAAGTPILDGLVASE